MQQSPEADEMSLKSPAIYTHLIIAILSAAIGAGAAIYSAGRNAYTKEDAVAQQAQIRIDQQKIHDDLIKYVDENSPYTHDKQSLSLQLHALDDAKARQEATLSVIQKDLGELRENRGAINAKLDILLQHAAKEGTR